MTFTGRIRPTHRDGLVRAALRGTAASRTPTEAGRAILAAAVDRLGAEGGCIYILDLRDGHYNPFVELGPLDYDRGPRADNIAIPPDRLTTSSHFIEASPGSDPTHDSSGVVVYSFRDRTCVGAIRIDGRSLASLDDDVREDLTASANLLVSIYEDAFAFNLLGALQEPLDFGVSDQDFFRDLSLWMAVSSGMEYVVLREAEEDKLRCIALWGFGDDPVLGEWDLDPIDDYPPFVRALNGKTVPVNEMDAPELAALRAKRWFKGVRSFVATPVHVGADIFGVLSLGARCPFEYAPLELRGFESIANGLGVSIANFRNSRALSGRVGEFAEAGVAITALEVARAARHEAHGAIANCNAGLHQLWKKLGSQAKNTEREFEGISQDLQRVNEVLNKIKFATKTPEQAWQTVTVRQVWDEARTAVLGRLQEDRIDVQYVGPAVTVRAQPDWLRQVFLNLLLNSIDAFRDAKKAGRRIELAVERPSERAKDVRMTYRDNATGINAQRLQGPEEFDELPVEQRVFAPGVTSKRSGSGFGLWLVRHILDEHRGSIDLVDHRGGVTFAIHLPKLDASEADR